VEVNLQINNSGIHAHSLEQIVIAVPCSALLLYCLLTIVVRILSSRLLSISFGVHFTIFVQVIKNNGTSFTNRSCGLDLA